MTVLPLEGYKSYKAYGSFHKLMMGLKCLPLYYGESYEDFFERIEAMPEKDQETMIREAALFVTLERDELDPVLSFCADANGVPYSAENIKNLSPGDIIEIIVAVAKQMAKIKINFVNEAEKKRSKIAQLI